MDNEEGNNFIGVIVIIALVWGGYSYFHKKEDTSTPYNSSQSANVINSVNKEVQEPENPYNEGTGHSAGYEWAEENDPSSCNGNSNSFIEGCEEYLSQQEEANY